MKKSRNSQTYEDKVLREGERIQKIIQELEEERLKTIGGGKDTDTLGGGGLGNEKEE